MANAFSQKLIVLEYYCLKKCTGLFEHYHVFDLISINLGLKGFYRFDTRFSLIMFWIFVYVSVVIVSIEIILLMTGPICVDGRPDRT